jgi:NtrC-family two-component system response regulator AlgB
VADSVGKVEEAEGGTLFLDEVGDHGMDAQTRLLRFLNDRTYERLGETKERKADVRLIAATNRPLEDEVQAGRIREDLLFRLNVISLSLPPLRERPEDVLPMAQYYLLTFQRLQGRQHLSFSPGCEQAIAAYDWPGNLRQLRNAVERAVILSPSSVLEAVDLGLSGGDRPDPERTEVALGAAVSLDVIEREHIARVVTRAASFEAAARTLGIDVTTPQRKRKRYGMS